MEKGGVVAKIKLTQSANRERARKVFDALSAEYPDAKCSLDHRNPLELMVATILSAQCTDERVNIVTKSLFKKYRTAKDYVAKPVAELEKDIQSCGFYRAKTKNIRGACQKLIDEHGGKVPRTLEELVRLPGVGRKTANVILGTAYDTSGVVVDTHCGRISRRLGFTKHTDPVKVEQDLMKIWEPEHWSLFSHLFVYHGRACCTSRSPACSRCPVRALCPFPDTREGQKVSR